MLPNQDVIQTRRVTTGDRDMALKVTFMMGESSVFLKTFCPLKEMNFHEFHRDRRRSSNV
jgi:hypothetical protein